MSIIRTGARQVRQRVFTILKKTTTRLALRFVVAQRQDEDGNLLLSTLSVIGRIYSYIEAPGYVRDIAFKLAAAAEQMEEWNKEVK